jgi:hypothetical protein
MDINNPVGINNLTSYRIRHLVEKLGMEVTFNFLNSHWHTKFFIPSTVSNKLIERVGDDVALTLVALYPGQHYQPPKPDKILELWRNHEIVRERNSGIKMEDLCKKYQITRQRINQIEHEVDPKHDLNFSLDFEF